MSDIERYAGDWWMESATITEDWREDILYWEKNVVYKMFDKKITFQNIISGNISQLDSMSEEVKGAVHSKIRAFFHGHI